MEMANIEFNWSRERDRRGRFVTKVEAELIRGREAQAAQERKAQAARTDRQAHGMLQALKKLGVDPADLGMKRNGEDWEFGYSIYFAWGAGLGLTAAQKWNGADICVAMSWVKEAVGQF